MRWSASFDRGPAVVYDENGASMLEYALLAACIAIVALTGVAFVGRQSHESFCSLAQATAPKYQPPTGGGEGEAPDYDDCGLIGGVYAP